MSRAHVGVWAVLLAGAWIAGCGPQDQKQIREQSQVTLKGFQPISYRRTNPAAAVEDRLTIAKDGTIETQGKLLGTHRGQASELQIMQLVMLFQGWERLQPNYSPSENAPNAPVTEIRWGEKTVVASDSNTTVPEQFVRARQRLESIGRQMQSPQ